MKAFNGRSILLGITGGVALYKVVGLASKLTQAGAVVDVMMTPGACEFVKPLMFAAITHRKVYVDPWDTEYKPEHIELAERPDLIVIAPATANTIAKMAAGIADNLLTSTMLATKKPVLLAPAMNVGMWNAKPTQRNVETLRNDGCKFVGPAAGNLACGYDGMGRMAEPEDILEAMARILEEEQK